MRRVSVCIALGKASSQCSPVKAANDTVLTDESDVKEQWSSLFEESHQADHPCRELQLEAAHAAVAKSLVSCGPELLRKPKR